MLGLLSFIGHRWYKLRDGGSSARIFFPFYHFCFRRKGISSFQISVVFFRTERQKMFPMLVKRNVREGKAPLRDLPYKTGRTNSTGTRLFDLVLAQFSASCLCSSIPRKFGRFIFSQKIKKKKIGGSALHLHIREAKSEKIEKFRLKMMEFDLMISLAK